MRAHDGTGNASRNVAGTMRALPGAAGGIAHCARRWGPDAVTDRLSAALPIRDSAERDEIAHRMQAFAAVSLALSVDAGESTIATRVWRELQDEVCGVAMYLDSDGQAAARLVSHAGFAEAPAADAAEGMPGHAMTIMGLALPGVGGQLLKVPESGRPRWLGADAAWAVAMHFSVCSLDSARGWVLFTLRTGAVSRVMTALLQQVAQRMGESLLSHGSGATSLPEGAATRQAIKVLLVDNDPLLLSDVGKFLCKRGFEFHSAPTARQGLDQARSIRPDVVLLENILPDMDGIELLRLLRGDEHLSTVPVIMLSGRSDEALRIRALRAGADDFVAKPFSSKELVARIHANVRMAQARRAAGWRESELVPLRHSQQELRTLLETIQNVRSEERRLLAREVHDQLGQLLTAAKIDIRLLEERVRNGEALDNEEMLRELGSARSSIDQALTSVQDISILLRPPALEDNGLVGALRWHAIDFQRRFNITCTVKHVEAGYMEPPRFVAGELFRICQEALTNVLRHAAATAVVIEVSVRGRTLLVRVCDNGVGIARGAADGPNAFGIAGIRERASSIRAKLRIHGRPGRGTLLAIRCRLAFP